MSLHCHSVTGFGAGWRLTSSTTSHQGCSVGHFRRSARRRAGGQYVAIVCGVMRRGFRRQPPFDRVTGVLRTLRRIVSGGSATPSPRRRLRHHLADKPDARRGNGQNTRATIPRQLRPADQIELNEPIRRARHHGFRETKEGGKRIYLPVDRVSGPLTVQQNRRLPKGDLMARSRNSGNAVQKLFTCHSDLHAFGSDTYIVP